MARKVTFKVTPPDGHHDVLTIQDAFQQAIDFFDLLTDGADKNVLWKLETASTNSPFTCQGEPIDRRTWAGAHAFVEERVRVVERNFSRIAEGKDFDDSFPKEKLDVAINLLKRTTNGVGMMSVSFSDGAKPVDISHNIAKRYFEEVSAPAESLHSFLFSSTTHKEVGSVEGRIIEIGTDYDAPALRLKEHNTENKIWCRVSAEMLEEIGAEMKASDVWGHRRVRIHGTLNYDNNGNVLRVVDGTIVYIDATAFNLDKLEDREFTGGYAVSEYLERLRENEFGD